MFTIIVTWAIFGLIYFLFKLIYNIFTQKGDEVELGYNWQEILLSGPIVWVFILIMLLFSEKY